MHWKLVGVGEMRWDAVRNRGIPCDTVGLPIKTVPPSVACTHVINYVRIKRHQVGMHWELVGSGGMQ